MMQGRRPTRSLRINKSEPRGRGDRRDTAQLEKREDLVDGDRRQETEEKIEKREREREGERGKEESRRRMRLEPAELESRR